MTDHAQTIGALGVEDPWTGGDPRVEVLARVSFGHEYGPCELVASVIRDSDYFGVMCSTYDNRCPHPHEPVKVLATGMTLFAACLEIYSCRRLDDRLLTLRPEQLDSNPPGPAPTHDRVQQLWIPPDHVENLHAAAAAALAALEQSQTSGQPRPRRGHGMRQQSHPLKDEYFRLKVQGEAPDAVRRHDGQIMQRFPFIDTDRGIGLASLVGRPDEGVGVRVPASWAVPLTPTELAHARWLARTFFDRERYVTEEERERMLCRSCQGSGLVGELHGHVILVTHESRAQLEADGAVVTECDGCHGFGVTGPEADALLSAEAEAES